MGNALISMSSLGLSKLLGRQQWVRPHSPLGQFTPTLEQFSPHFQASLTLGQKLQASFLQNLALNQNIAEALPDLSDFSTEIGTADTKVPNISAQWIHSSLDDPASASSAIFSQANTSETNLVWDAKPLGSSKLMAARPPLAQSSNFLILQSSDEPVPSTIALNSTQLSDRDAIVTPERIEPPIQAKFQPPSQPLQPQFLQPQSPVEIQPSVENEPRVEDALNPPELDIPETLTPEQGIVPPTSLQMQPDIETHSLQADAPELQRSTSEQLPAPQIQPLVQPSIQPLVQPQVQQPEPRLEPQEQEGLTHFAEAMSAPLPPESNSATPTDFHSVQLQENPQINKLDQVELEKALQENRDISQPLVSSDLVSWEQNLPLVLTEPTQQSLQRRAELAPEQEQTPMSLDKETIPAERLFSNLQAEKSVLSLSSESQPVLEAGKEPRIIAPASEYVCK